MILNYQILTFVLMTSPVTISVKVDGMHWPQPSWELHPSTATAWDLYYTCMHEVSDLSMIKKKNS